MWDSSWELVHLVLPHKMNRDWKPLPETLDGPVLSGPMAVRGTVGLRRGAPPLAKRHLDGEDA
jgi:hypothetical protein